MNLFKYMTEKRVEDILVKNKIRFTQPKYFNDPFDVQPHLKSFNIKNYANKLDDKSKDEMASSLINILIENGMGYKYSNTEETRKAFLKGLDELSIDNISNSIRNVFNEEINDIKGILSLTNNEKNLLMWAHYSNEHKGFVVEFDRNSELFKNAFEVDYKEERPSVNIRRIEPNKTFLTKSIDWEYENEYRVFKNLNEALIEDINLEKDIYLFRFPKIAIKSIYCGCNMDIDIKKNILYIIESDKELHHVKVFDTYISDKYYKLEFEQIR